MIGRLDINECNRKSDLRDLLVRSGVSLIVKLAGAALAFFATLLVSRSLGAYESGKFFLCFAVIVVVAAITRLGLDQKVTQIVAAAKDRDNWPLVNSLYRSANFATLATACAACACLCTGSAVISRYVFDQVDLAPCLFWMSLSLPGFALAWLHSHFFQGMEEIKTFQLFQYTTLFTFFLSILCVLKFLTHVNMDNAEVCSQAFFASATLNCVVSHIVWSRRHSWFAWCLLPRHQVLNVSLLPFLGLVIVSQLNIWLPQIYLGAVAQSSEVGIYNASFRIANLTSLALAGVNSVVFPRFAALYKQSEHERLQSLAQSSVWLMILACVPLLMLLLIFPSQILSLFGSEFVQGSNALRIVSVGQLFNVLTGSVAGLLLMTDNQGYAVRCSAFAFVAMTSLLVVVTPRLGAEGAATAQAFGLIIEMFLMSVVCKRTLGFAPIEALYRFPLITRSSRD